MHYKWKKEREENVNKRDSILFFYIEGSDTYTHSETLYMFFIFPGLHSDGRISILFWVLYCIVSWIYLFICLFIHYKCCGSRESYCINGTFFCKVKLAFFNVPVSRNNWNAFFFFIYVHTYFSYLYLDCDWYWQRLYPFVISIAIFAAACATAGKGIE